MNLLKFAAIDIGTNAMRLLLANVIEDNGETYFKKSALVRMPIRLGEDVFEYGLKLDANVSNNAALL